jgi:hypothetical protein
MAQQLRDLHHDPVAQAQVGAAIALAVSKSFVEDKSTQTQDEIKRRTQMCLGHFKIMRNELKWSIPKICDLLPRSLRAELDGDYAAFLDSMDGRGWLKHERRTPGGLILP